MSHFTMFDSQHYGDKNYFIVHGDRKSVAVILTNPNALIFS